MYEKDKLRPGLSFSSLNYSLYDVIKNHLHVSGGCGLSFPVGP